MNNSIDSNDSNEKEETGQNNQSGSVTEPNESVRYSFSHEHSLQTQRDARLAAGTEPEISRFLKTDVNSESPETLSMDAASVVQGVGHTLRNARIARRMSADDVSRQLRISVQQVEAIEKEDFDALPGRTFTRGFVRNYANLMQLDANAVLQMLPGPKVAITHVEHTPFKIQEMTASSKIGKGVGSVLQIIVIGAALTVVGYFLYQKFPLWEKTGIGENVAESVAQQEDGQTSVQLQLPLPSLNLSENPAAAPLLKQSAVPLNPQVSQNVIANLNTIGTLVLTFSADAHVKVTDGNGDVIFDQNNIRGTQQRVSGKRPLSVAIAKASAVELNFNDRIFDIKPYTHAKNGSAQLTLE